MNSPETDIFHKGRQLYGLYEAQQDNAEPNSLSLLIGAKSLPASVVLEALSGTCQSADCTIVLDARLPRTLAGLLAGGALGLAGALMQTLTRNPLADPG
ncbi:iron chelate uptake ABC transporter family permease subunit, partial [Escherichia coli]|uniref:iron chelate uptake ABC transporter family permease subunit n=1 Tax=Escherichia coli TaxID=562 RepID=UPI00210CCA53